MLLEIMLQESLILPRTDWRDTISDIMNSHPLAPVRSAAVVYRHNVPVLHAGC